MSRRAVRQLEAVHTRTGSEVAVGDAEEPPGHGKPTAEQQGWQNCPSEQGEERGQTVARYTYNI